MSLQILEPLTRQASKQYESNIHRPQSQRLQGRPKAVKQLQAPIQTQKLSLVWHNNFNQHHTKN